MGRVEHKQGYINPREGKGGKGRQKFQLSIVQQRLLNAGNFASKYHKIIGEGRYSESDGVERQKTADAAEAEERRVGDGGYTGGQQKGRQQRV